MVNLKMMGKLDEDVVVNKTLALYDKLSNLSSVTGNLPAKKLTNFPPNEALFFIYYDMHLYVLFYDYKHRRAHVYDGDNYVRDDFCRREQLILYIEAIYALNHVKTKISFVFGEYDESNKFECDIATAVLLASSISYWRRIKRPFRDQLFIHPFYRNNLKKKIYGDKPEPRSNYKYIVTPKLSCIYCRKEFNTRCSQAIVLHEKKCLSSAKKDKESAKLKSCKQKQKQKAVKATA